MSKIQFWKQFTTIYNKYSALIDCIRYVKDTILKAIYNPTSLIIKRQSYCIRYVKDTILKAIYNPFIEI